MNLELQTLYTIWMLVTTAINLFIGLYTWISSRDKVGREAIGQVGTTLAHIDNRVTKLEEAIKHMPDEEDLAVLHKRITEVSECQKTMQGELHHMNKTLGLIHSYLLTNRDKR